MQLTLRIAKGSELTFQEGDDNFSLLDRKMFKATTDPGASNDETEGFQVDSRWKNIPNGKTFICTDATEGAAVWIEDTIGFLKANGAYASAGYSLAKYSANTRTAPGTFGYDFSSSNSGSFTNITPSGSNKVGGLGDKAITFGFNVYAEETCTNCLIIGTMTDLPAP